MEEIPGDSCQFTSPSTIHRHVSCFEENTEHDKNRPQVVLLRSFGDNVNYITEWARRAAQLHI